MLKSFDSVFCLCPEPIDPNSLQQPRLRGSPGQVPSHQTPWCKSQPFLKTLFITKRLLIDTPRNFFLQTRVDGFFTQPWVTRMNFLAVYNVKWRDNRSIHASGQVLYDFMQITGDHRSLTRWAVNGLAVNELLTPLFGIFFLVDVIFTISFEKSGGLFISWGFQKF